MNRTQKRFVEKVGGPVLKILSIVAAGTITHFVASLFGYTLGHVIAYAGILIVYLGVPLLITGAIIVALGIYICDKWREAKLEVEQENGELIEVIRND